MEHIFFEILFFELEELFDNSYLKKMNLDSETIGLPIDPFFWLGELLLFV